MSRKAKTVYVSRGYLTGQGQTKSEARADLDKQIEWACNHGGATIESRFGLLIIISANSNGFEHTIIDPSASMAHGSQKHCSCCHGQIERSEVLLSARSHAAQWAWKHEIADDAKFVAMADLDKNRSDDLARWIRFQRNYRDAKQAGADDNTAFNAALNHAA